MESTPVHGDRRIRKQDLEKLGARHCQPRRLGALGARTVRAYTLQGKSDWRPANRFRAPALIDT